MTLKERWSEYKLTADERPKRVYEYFVSGSGDFPFDMLRYDAAWPVDSTDAYNIGVHYPQDEAFKIVRSIRLRSYKPPTIARWSSFTWSVGTENVS
jgi:hypothetical protein